MLNYIKLPEGNHSRIHAMNSDHRAAILGIGTHFTIIPVTWGRLELIRVFWWIPWNLLCPFTTPRPSLFSMAVVLVWREGSKNSFRLETDVKDPWGRPIKLWQQLDFSKTIIRYKSESTLNHCNTQANAKTWMKDAWSNQKYQNNPK